LPASRWLAASCHNAEELALAEEMGVDFVTLSPVQPTSPSGRPTAGLGTGLDLDRRFQQTGVPARWRWACGGSEGLGGGCARCGRDSGFGLRLDYAVMLPTSSRACPRRGPNRRRSTSGFAAGCQRISATPDAEQSPAPSQTANPTID
jgi:hypothetical protein